MTFELPLLPPPPLTKRCDAFLYRVTFQLASLYFLKSRQILARALTLSFLSTPIINLGERSERRVATRKVVPVTKGENIFFSSF